MKVKNLKCHAEALLLSISTLLRKQRDPEQKHLRMTQSVATVRGFTLIELLVVVLIIGILSAIALPQYRMAVEKARVTEALQNIRMLEEQAKLYVLENGLPTNNNIVYLKDVLSVELSGGEWDGYDYNTDNFSYYAYITANGIGIEVTRQGPYYYQFFVGGVNNVHECLNGAGDEMGIKICHMLESQGWTYQEGEF